MFLQRFHELPLNLAVVATVSHCLTSATAINFLPISWGSSACTAVSYFTVIIGVLLWLPSTPCVDALRSLRACYFPSHKLSQRVSGSSKHQSHTGSGRLGVLALPQLSNSVTRQIWPSIKLLGKASVSGWASLHALESTELRDHLVA